MRSSESFTIKEGIENGMSIKFYETEMRIALGFVG